MYGLAGITLGAIVQSGSTVIAGVIVGLVYGWKLALVGVATIPFVISSGYVRLVRLSQPPLLPPLTEIPPIAYCGHEGSNQQEGSR